MASSDPPYPKEWETDALLSDGSTVRIRPISPGDRELLVDFHGRQSPQSIYFRYFSPHPRLSDKELDHLTTLDYRTRMAFVAVVADRLVGVARYEGWSTDRAVALTAALDAGALDAGALDAGALDAEVSFFVDDGFQGRGLGTLMLEYLAAAGRYHGISGFVAHVLPENYGMLRVFRRAGFAVRTGFEEGVIKVALGIDVTAEASAAIDARERAAQAKSIARILEPSSVAVIGAGRHRDSVGHRLTRSLVNAAFAGRLQVVSRHGQTIAGVTTVASVAELAGPVDLGVICVPADEVLEAAEQCIELGVAGLLVISGGFADVGPLGANRERQLVDLARGNGLRLIGPNAFGVANTDPSIRLSALFMPVEVPVGEVGLLSQSGPLGAALLAVFERAGTGISSFIALGNRADVSVNDLLQYWAADPRTKAIALYLENFGNFGNFTRIARSVAMSKPIVAVAPLDLDRGELVRQAGVVLVSEVGELAAQARVAVTQALPEGRRVAVVSNASSVARLCVAACRSAGLEVVVPAPFRSGETEWVRVGDAERLALPGNDTQPDYERSVVAAAVSAGVDAVLVALVPAPGLAMGQLAALLDRIDRAVAKPMVAVGLTGVSLGDVTSLPLFDFPEQAAKALSKWAEYGMWRRLDRGAPLVPTRPEDLEVALDDLLAAEDGHRRSLRRSEVERVLALCAIDAAPARMADDAQAAVAAAAELGYPVVLKAGGASPRLAGEAGGVALDLQDDDQVASAFGRMAEHIESFAPAIVQPMVPTGLHLVIEAGQDPEHGARLGLSVRGGSSSSLGVRRMLLLPATAADVARMIDLVVADTYMTAVARTALETMVANLAAAVASAPSLVQVELNPVLLSDHQVVAVDAAIEVAPFDRDPLAEVRHL